MRDLDSTAKGEGVVGQGQQGYVPNSGRRVVVQIVGLLVQSLELPVLLGTHKVL